MKGPLKGPLDGLLKRYTEIMLGCIVLGEKNAFPVDFNTGKTIGHLKIVIKEQAGLDSPAHKLKLWKVNIPESEKHKIYEGIDVKVKFGATGQKRYADSESVDTEPKRKKDTPTFENLIADLGEKISVGRPPELYPRPNIAGRFHKRDIPISGSKYVDMRLDVETTDTGRELIDNLKNEDKACYFLYAVSGAGKTRAIFDMSMNENGIYVVYVECRPSPDDSNWDFEPTMDRNFAQLVASIDSAFGPYNDNINKSARAEAKRLIILEFTARILHLIILKKKFPDITPRDYLLSQLNGGQQSIETIRDELRLLRLAFDDLKSIITSALRFLKIELPGQKSLIFAIDESNIASNKLFSGYFININQHPRGLLTPIIEILRLFKISIVISGTAFSLKQGSDIQSDIGKGNEAKYITNFNTTNSKDVEAYIMHYLDLSGCEIDKIVNSKYLVGRPRLVACLVKEIIDAENPQESKHVVLETAVNKTVQLVKNGMTCHLEKLATEAYEKENLRNVALRKILMTLFINCREIDDDSAKLVDCGIASLTSDKYKKFWQVKEPLAIETVKLVLHFQYKSPTELLINKLFEELRHSVDYDDNSNTSKGIMWQYFVIGRLMDFKNKTVFDFVNEIYNNQS
ncbi:3171_t:CDS:2 [Funneliformis mosseae]|uniref:3171_t:CDS:1 n=1 Tax=Funneliformis mosseae TaxID=27381 RepID=A0A9N9GDC4_FUNMO|nr:3171_t:CDS:2 [Funneliformis mosseae]